jgi:hypothetical protein
MRLAIAAFLAASLAACSDQGPGALALLVTEGDRQVARIGTPLPEPVAVTVLDEAGRPLEGQQVTWQPDDGGRITPFNTRTDANGISRARWILGSVEGERTATASLPGAAPAVVTAVAEPSDALAFDLPAPLAFATYDGSGQVVHPDFAATPATIFGTGYHLAITPYPFGNAIRENPSLFSGRRPDTWDLDPGAPNPVVLPQAGYLSDPDIVYQPDARELWLYYRQVTDRNVVHLIRSTTGIAWSAPVDVVSGPNHDVVSPSVVRRGPGDWWMWSVKSGPLGCGAPSTTVEVRRSMDGIAWSDPETTDLTAGALWPWHLDVQWIPSRNEFWAVFNAKTATGCTTPALYLATSTDGTTWQTVERPVLMKGRIPAFQDIVYRSTFAYDPNTDAVTFWYSGAKYESGNYVWSAAVERRHRTDLFVNFSQLEDGILFTPPPAPLADWP